MYTPADAAYCLWAACIDMSESIFHRDLKKGKRTLKPVCVEENTLL